MIEIWALLSLSAALLWAISNIIDKFVISKLISNPIIPVIISGFIALAVGLAVIFFHGIGNLNFWQITLALAGGAVYVFVLFFYFKAIKIGDVSTLVPLFYLVPLFIGVIAWFLLGERFGLIKYAGIILLVSGAFLISWDSKNPLKFGKAFWLMIAATFLLAINQVITKYLLNFSDFWTIFAYVSIGCFLPVILLLPKNFRELENLIKKNVKTVGFILSSEFLYRTANALITYAVAIGSVTLVNALSSVQPFFVLLFMVLFSVFAPHILKEDIGRQKILLKVIAIALMFAGAMFVS